MPHAPLAVGAFGADVANLQRALLLLGVYLPGSEVQRQFFGPGTRQAVLQVQGDNDLPATGDFDERTSAVLSALVARADQNRPVSAAGSSAVLPPEAPSSATEDLSNQDADGGGGAQASSGRLALQVLGQTTTHNCPPETRPSVAFVTPKTVIFPGQPVTLTGGCDPGTRWRWNPADKDCDPADIVTFSDVSVTLDGTQQVPVTDTDLSGGWGGWSATTTFTQGGTHTATAVATTSAGIQYRATLSVLVAPSIPNLSVTEPSGGATIGVGALGGTVPVTAVTDDGAPYGGFKVTAQPDTGSATQLTLTTGSTTQWTGSVTLAGVPLGARSLTVTCSYVLAPQLTNTVTVPLVAADIEPPETVTLTNPPPSGAVVVDATMTIQVAGTADDANSGMIGGKAQVTVALSPTGPRIPATPVAGNDWSAWTAAVQLTGYGSYTLYAWATDAAGNATPASTPWQWEFEAITGVPAPVWLYSALALLGGTFTASDGSTQAFGSVVCGSDVDPYAELGAARLFCIGRSSAGFTLGVSPDSSSPAPVSGSGSFPDTDQGIMELFTILVQAPAFAAAKYAYIPGGRPGAAVSAGGLPLSGGYDPATGLREMVLGSAVTQVVPLATFEASSNTQVYNPSPVIVPVMTSLVYDITENNTSGSTTYTLPVAYVLDQVTPGTIYVNKMAGPTIVNAGGPGYSQSDPTAVFSGFTFTGSSALAAFASQRIAGFYVGPGWQDTLGTPIWDFGPSNSQFTAVPGTLANPVKVFDPASSPLNGGTIPAVVSTLQQAQYLMSRDLLASMLASALAGGEGASGAPPAAATAASLSFDFPATTSPTLQVTDSSLFIFSNIDADNGKTGQVSPSNVFVAGGTVNSAPTTRSATAFAPNPFLLGLVRSVQMGGTQQFAFIPEDDSIEIDGTRYLVSVIPVNGLSLDPNSLPYPPSAWCQSQYWQFANRHDPYLAVRYTGATEADRTAQAQTDVAAIGLAASAAQEPMQMYLDTGARGMELWPIYGFPLTSETQTLNVATLNSLNKTILGLISDPVVYSGAAAAITNLGEITVPAALTRPNPYAATPGTLTSASTTSAVVGVPGAGTITIPGIEVTNLNPNVAIAPTFAASIAAQRSADILAAQQEAANVSAAKRLVTTAAPPQLAETAAPVTSAEAAPRTPQAVFGFSAYSSSTGEAYLIEVVGADLTVPDRLPGPTENADYDPYYVRVVFLSNLTCYSMSVIVPSMAYDKRGYFAQKAVEYDNLLAKTDELSVGYMYSLHDSSNNFDELFFIPYVQPSAQTAIAEGAASSGDTPFVVTNDDKPYSIRQSATPPPYFVCRRKNWSADCHLMQATVPLGTSIYLAFGGGDIIPMRLDTPPMIDKRLPTHMNQLSYAFTSAAYAAVEAFSVANIPYVVAVSTVGGVAAYSSLSIDPTAGTTSVTTSTPAPLTFPSDIYVVGRASTTLTSVTTLNTTPGSAFTSTGDFSGTDANGNAEAAFAIVPRNNLVYLVRAMTDVTALGAIGGTGITSGLLIDTFVPTTAGNLALAQSARYKRSGLAFFGQSYTPTTMIDSLDNLDFTDIAGSTFYAPTIFIPIAELDATPGIVADIANFTGEEFWTFLYAEQSAASGAAVGGVQYPSGLNIDQDGKPILSVQKLQFVYDQTAVLFTPNDLTHKYPLSPKQQVLALTNGQIQEGICWRSANLQPDRVRPHNVQGQQILGQGWDMDATNIIYSPSNRPVQTTTQASYRGMSIHSIKSLSATTYNIEESAFGADPTARGFVSAVSSVQNMLLGVIFDYDNNDLGTLDTYDPSASTKGLVFVNGYLSGGGYAFSSPDHMDVNDVLPSELPLLEQVASTLGLGWDVAMYNVDVTLPREFWTFSYDTATAPSLPNFIPNVPPAPADPGFTNRTRSVLLNLQNPVQPTQIGLMDTYSSVVSANLVLDNGVTASVFLSKKADRNVAAIGSNPKSTAVPPLPGSTFPLTGLPPNYDFFLFSRDHYDTLDGAQFLLTDEGYAMVLVDDGTGTGTKVAKYSVDTDGNYYELFSYVLLSPQTGVLETSTFPLKVTLGSPANPNTTPPTPETPNSVNPQDLAAQINSVSGLIYTAFGASSPGQPPAYLPIQAISLGDVQAGTITGQPGFTGYALNVISQNHQPVLITQLYAGSTAYQIAGTTTIVPYNYAKQKALPYYGSISHGLDKQVTLTSVSSTDGSVTIPRPTVPQTITQGVFGGAGVGGLIGTTLSFVFQGSAAIPPPTSAVVTPGTTMKGDDSVLLHRERRCRDDDGLNRQVRWPRRRPVLHRQHRPRESDLRRRHAAEVLLQAQLLHGEPRDDRSRDRRTPLHPRRRRPVVPVQSGQQRGHSGPDDVHLQPDLWRRLHRHVLGA